MVSTVSTLHITITLWQLAHIPAKFCILLIIFEEYRKKKKKTMAFIKPKQRKSHKHGPIVKNILIKAINILTLHTTEAKLGKPIFPSLTYYYYKVLISVQFIVFYVQFLKTSILNTSKFWYFDSSIYKKYPKLEFQSLNLAS